jgi:hypothetical protein
VRVPLSPQKKLCERIKPSLLLQVELEAQLKSLNLDSSEESIKLPIPQLSVLEAYLWRDIEYFYDQGYIDIEIVSRSLERLREKNAFISALEELVNRQI